jgi:hypothetical protein
VRTMRHAPTTWRIAAPLAALALAAIAIGACGSDSGSCDYLFANVPTQDDCGAGRITPTNPPIEGSLQSRYDCGNAVYTPGTGDCKLISCQVCTNADADFDSDL